VSFNVATLLQEPVGSRRRARLDGEPLAVPDERWSREVSGDVELLRTVRGVLVRARLHCEPVLECARCLETFFSELELAIDEEFVPPIDLLTGEPIEAEDDDELRIDELHQLDLSEAVRQYEQTAIPLQPMCRPDCAGLCPQCGRNRNEGACGCAERTPSGPFEALAGLGERLRAEESDGPTEA
jgi:uncharacterized protein